MSDYTTTRQKNLDRQPCTLKDVLAEKAKREANKQYVGFVEKPDMEDIVKQAMTEVYSKHTAGMEDAGDVMAKQIGGNHYKRTKIQPWDIYSDYKLDPWSANVVKYILRFPHKAGLQDLEKAKHYIEYLIQNYETVYHGYYD